MGQFFPCVCMCVFALVYAFALMCVYVSACAHVIVCM